MFGMTTFLRSMLASWLASLMAILLTIPAVAEDAALTKQFRELLDTEWQTTENNRRAKYYSLTTAGRRALGQELASWNRFVGAVTLVLSAEA